MVDYRFNHNYILLKTKIKPMTSNFHFLWEKQGLVFKPNGEYGWINSHAQVPTVLVKEKEGIVRVFFATRPKAGCTLISYADLDINNLKIVLRLSSKPVLELGRPGTFDEHGTMPSSIVAEGDNVFLYYSGWQRSTGVPYNNYTGCALSIDGGDTFKKIYEAPILDRNYKELFSATSPSVIKEENIWKMWYCSGVNWLIINNKCEHVYDIKYAESFDGIKWKQNIVTAIPQNTSEEAITKPTVIKIDGMYHMWFCYRGSRSFRKGVESYKIGYAHSPDGIKWQRLNERAGITLSKSGWDSKMIAYPEVADILGTKYLFYNGNGFGKSGFGYAKLKHEQRI